MCFVNVVDFLYSQYVELLKIMCFYCEHTHDTEHTHPYVPLFKRNMEKTVRVPCNRYLCTLQGSQTIGDID